MPRRREALSPAQRAEFFAIPDDERLLVKYYLLSIDDLTLINKRRRAPNRLGFALQLCCLRYPGQPLRFGQEPPSPLLQYVAKQLNIEADEMRIYAKRENTFYEHLVELQELYGFRAFTGSLYRQMAAWLLPSAMQTNQFRKLVTETIEEMRCRLIILPAITVIERLCAEVATRAERMLFRQLTCDLTEEHGQRLDILLTMKDKNSTILTWLRQPAGAVCPANIGRLLEKVNHIRSLKLPAGIRSTIHPNRLIQLAREGVRSGSQQISRYDVPKRYAILVAVVLDTYASLIDDALEMQSRIMGNLQSKARGKQEKLTLANSQEINEQLVLEAKILSILEEAHEKKENPTETIGADIGWNTVKSALDTLRKLLSDRNLDHLVFLNEDYYKIRRYSAAFLESFTFEGATVARNLLEAVAELRWLNRRSKRKMRESAPVAFLAPQSRWYRHVVTKDGLNRRFYEFAVLAELGNALRSGDIWVTDSRQFRNLEEYLLGWDEFKALPALPVVSGTDITQSLKEWDEELHTQLDTINRLGKKDQLPEVRLENGFLKFSPLPGTVPIEVKALSTKIDALIPKIDITDLLLEVDEWTGFTRYFTHLQKDTPPPDRILLLTILLADATNLGYWKMADACPGSSADKMQSLSHWHLRDDTFKKALAEVVHYHRAQPLTTVWGDGVTSSSDGQRFKTGAHGKAAGQVNLRYGLDPGITFYTHISDQYTPFHVKAIGSTVRDATYVLDGLLYHETNLKIIEHYTDTAGFTDHVFALCHLLGFSFCPRLRDIQDQKLYLVTKRSYPALDKIMGGVVDQKCIVPAWQDILRLATSIHQGKVTASLMLRKLASYPRQNTTAVGLREIGKIRRTLHIARWIMNPEQRRITTEGLNKGEARNALADAVVLHRQGEIRDRSLEDQQHRASALNLVTALIVLWNTVYMQEALNHLRQTAYPLTDDLISHLSPLKWAHINLTGHYIWKPQINQKGKLRPLRNQKIE